MNRRTFLTASFAASSAMLLSACGFQLRGSKPLPSMPALTLEGDTNSAVALQVTSRLQQLGTEVTANAPWRVTLGTPVLTERRLGGDGRASREHELTLSIRFSVQERATNAYHINNEALSTSTRIRVSEDDLLNRETLMREAEQTLTQQLSQQIIDRLSYVEGMQ
ncbi:LPS-assembly lipoprotein LptE [Vreelandella sp. H-I2]